MYSAENIRLVENIATTVIIANLNFLNIDYTPWASKYSLVKFVLIMPVHDRL